MNILFLSITRFDNIDTRGIYPDLMREFINRGHDVYIASALERRFGKQTYLVKAEHCQFLNIATLNIRSAGLMEKGISMLMLDRQFDKAISRYWGDVPFDIVLYATPPVTFYNAIKHVKERCKCRSYLMLKDIFPQNAVDLGLMKPGGLLYKVFRKKEKRLYELSDRIGCMSEANVEYVIDNNPEIDPANVELCPNAIQPLQRDRLSDMERNKILSRYNIPVDKTIFINGGNLGKPQVGEFLFKVLEANESRADSHIVLIGDGTEFKRVERWFDEHKPSNATLLSAMPKDEYDEFIRACHVGMIFLDRRFTIPNFPSRLLTYLENRMPVVVASDVSTDIGRIAEEGGFGLWCESGDLETFVRNMTRLSGSAENIKEMGCRGYDFMVKNYSVDLIADNILNEK